MSHLHPKPQRKKKGKNALITHTDVDMAIRAFKERGGLIEKLPDERVVASQKVGVSSLKWPSHYEVVSGVNMPEVLF